MIHQRRRNTLRIMLASLCVVALGIGAKLYTAKREKSPLPDAIWAVLENADRYELLSIDPNDDVPTTAPSDATTRPTLGGFSIFGTLPITDAEQRTQLNDALRNNLVEKPKWLSLCLFSPRHAIRAVKGTDEVWVLICFHCGDVHYFGAGASGSTHVKIETPPIFNDLLKAAKIPQDPGA